eukprot:476745_1
MLILGHRLKKNLTHSNFLKNKHVRSDVGHYMMKNYGIQCLQATNIPGQTQIDELLGGIEATNEYGHYKAVNIKPKWNKMFLRIWFDIIYTDKNGVSHYER